MDAKLKIALNRLVNEDAYLLANNLNERTIMHRLAIYYANQYSKWNVDCEYNTNLGQTKELDIDPLLFISRMAEIIENDLRISDRQTIATFLRRNELSTEDFQYLARQLRQVDRLLYDAELDALLFVLQESPDVRPFTKSIFPDVIVHKRGERNNHVVLEAKKSTSYGRVARAFDLVKLYTLVTHPDYHYKRGYFIDLPVANHFKNHKGFKFIKDLSDSRVVKVVSVRL